MASGAASLLSGRYPVDSFTGKVIRAGLWAGGLRAVERVFGLVRVTVLASLLAPRDLGLFGMVLLVVGAFEALSQTGARAVLIHHRGDLAAHLDTAWTIQLVRGLLLSAIVFTAAPAAAAFFAEPRTTGMLRVLGLWFAIQGAANIAVALLERELAFGKRFAYHFSGTCVDLVVTIGAAVLLRSPWALVVGMIAGSITRTVASYIVHPYRPRLTIDRGAAGDLIRYGRWVWLTALSTFLVLHLDDVLVGRILGATELAFYQMAFLFSSVAAMEVTRISSDVALPAFAKLQDQTERLRFALRRSLQLTMAINVPVAVAIALFAPDLVALLLGDEWVAMVPALQVLAVAALVRAIIATGGPLYQAVGQPRRGFHESLVRLLVLGLVLYPLTVQVGILGAAATVLAAILAAVPVWWRNVSAVLGVERGWAIRPMLTVCVQAAPAMFALWLMRRLLSPLEVGEFCLAMIAGLVVHAASLYVWHRSDLAAWRSERRQTSPVELAKCQVPSR